MALLDIIITMDTRPLEKLVMTSCIKMVTLLKNFVSYREQRVPTIYDNFFKLSLNFKKKLLVMVNV